MAVAVAAENRAKVEENRAKVVLAESEVPLEEVAKLDELNAQQPLSDEELARQALEAGGDDNDPATPE